MYYEIETRFNIGQQVYYISGGKILERTINDIALYKPSKNCDFKIVYKMGVFEEEEPKTFGKFFTTKEELIKHLVNQL